MLQALNTGHAGSMTTVHSNSAADALRRIETLALMADVALPHVAVRQQLASAIDMVVHLERTPQGSSAGREIVGGGAVRLPGGSASSVRARGGALLRVAADGGPLRPMSGRRGRLPAVPCGRRARGPAGRVPARARGSGAGKPLDRLGERVPFGLVDRTFAPFAGPRPRPESVGGRAAPTRVSPARWRAPPGWIVGGGGAAFVAGIAGALLLPRVATWRRVRYGRRVGAGAAGRGALDVRRACRRRLHPRGDRGGRARARWADLGRAAPGRRRAGGGCLAGRRAGRPDRAGALAIDAPDHGGGATPAALGRRSCGPSATDRPLGRRRAPRGRGGEHGDRAGAGHVDDGARPTAAGIAFAEVASPGLVGRMLGSPFGVSLVIAAGALQAVGAVAVRRLARIGP